MNKEVKYDLTIYLLLFLIILFANITCNIALTLILIPYLYIKLRRFEKNEIIQK